MVYLIPKSEMPQLQYTPVKYKEEITMMAVTPKGPVVLYTDTDEVLFVTWDEIIAYAATAQRQKIPEEPESVKETEPAPTKKLRDVPPAKH
jgi:hypothetical protein